MTDLETAAGEEDLDHIEQLFKKAEEQLPLLQRSVVLLDLEEKN